MYEYNEKNQTKVNILAFLFIFGMLCLAGIGNQIIDFIF
jgi:hypothetical protein